MHLPAREKSMTLGHLFLFPVLLLLLLQALLSNLGVEANKLDFPVEKIKVCSDICKCFNTLEEVSVKFNECVKGHKTEDVFKIKLQKNLLKCNFDSIEIAKNKVFDDLNISQLRAEFTKEKEDLQKLYGVFDLCFTQKYTMAKDFSVKKCIDEQVNFVEFQKDENKKQERKDEKKSLQNLSEKFQQILTLHYFYDGTSKMMACKEFKEDQFLEKFEYENINIFTVYEKALKDSNSNHVVDKFELMKAVFELSNKIRPKWSQDVEKDLDRVGRMCKYFETSQDTSEKYFTNIGTFIGYKNVEAKLTAYFQETDSITPSSTSTLEKERIKKKYLDDLSSDIVKGMDDVKLKAYLTLLTKFKGHFKDRMPKIEKNYSEARILLQQQLQKPSFVTQSMFDYPAKVAYIVIIVLAAGFIAFVFLNEYFDRTEL